MRVIACERFVLDASIALQSFLEDESDRKYSLGVLARPSKKRVLVPSFAGKGAEARFLLRPEEEAVAAPCQM